MRRWFHLEGFRPQAAFGRSCDLSSHRSIRTLDRLIMNLFLRAFVAVALLAATRFTILPLAATEILPPGFRPLPPGAHALTGVKVFVKPGETLDGATILIRDGFIKA